MKMSRSEATSSAIIMVKAASISNLSCDEKEVILRNGSQVDQACLHNTIKRAFITHACFNANEHI